LVFIPATCTPSVDTQLLPGDSLPAARHGQWPSPPAASCPCHVRAQHRHRQRVPGHASLEGPPPVLAQRQPSSQGHQLSQRPTHSGQVLLSTPAAPDPWCGWALASWADRSHLLLRPACPVPLSSLSHSSSSASVSGRHFDIPNPHWWGRPSLPQLAQPRTPQSSEPCKTGPDTVPSATLGCPTLISRTFLPGYCILGENVFITHTDSWERGHLPFLGVELRASHLLDRQATT
jgi:hypothetical protein